MTDIKKGDRVKVTIEGVVFEDGTRDITVGTSIINSAIFPKVTKGDDLSVTVEKIEPPVEVFKPGDRVRHRDSEFEVTISDDGYLIHHTSGEHSWIGHRNPDQFTTEWYDRVYPG